MSSWLPTFSAVPLTTTVVPPAMGPKVGVTLLTVGATVISILKTEKNLTLLPVYNSNIKVSAEPFGLFSFEMDTQDSGRTPIIINT